MFVSFPFRFCLNLCDSRGLAIPQFWLAAWLRFCIAAFHGRWNEGAEGCFKFYILCSLLLGDFRNTMRVLYPRPLPPCQNRELKPDPLVRVAGNMLYYLCLCTAGRWFNPEIRSGSYFDVFCVNYSQRQFSLASESYSSHRSFCSSLCSATLIGWLLSRCSWAEAVRGVLRFGTVNS